MTEKPVLIGLWHNKSEINGVKDLIKKYGGKGKKLALETPHNDLTHYWHELRQFAEERGMKVIGIDSRYANKVLDGIQEGQFLRAALSAVGKKPVWKEPTSKKIKRKYKEDIIAGPLREEFMVLKIRKTKPDVIVVGTLHTPAIRRAVPCKFVQFGTAPIPTLGSKAKLLLTKAKLEAERVHWKMTKAVKMLKRKFRRK